jgi:serine/threonine-protein kinase
VLPVEPGDRAPIGLRIQDRYRIAGELGAGPFGTVCLAEDEATGHRVAIRLLPHALAGALHAAQSVRRVGRSIVAASKSHPGLARVLEFGEVEHGRPFVAMELVEGRRLSEILSEGKPLDVGAALRLALDLGGAVETLHNMGLVHGALRPRNVMVLADWRVKLMDLELIGLRDASATKTVLAAEPPAEYLSPEQVRRAPLTEGTDIYAFAVILYEMLGGAPFPSRWSPSSRWRSPRSRSGGRPCRASLTFSGRKHTARRLGGSGRLPSWAAPRSRRRSRGSGPGASSRLAHRRRPHSRNRRRRCQPRKRR